jgi:crotonobetainyl-CoA:carnitine CoA-transferase CaiB-like acyl-CoA transferase
MPADKAQADGWLSPYRVVDLTDERGLLAGQILAKLGADVIQVEPPAGSSARAVGPFDDEGRSCFWSAYAAGKRGVTLDLETPAGRDLLLRLVATADFLIESADPGAMAALGLDEARLRETNPRLIHVSITAFGSDGPKRDYAASDLTLWAAGGPLHPHRCEEGRPLRISVPQAWLHASADAAGAALVAHFARLKSGAGQHVEISAQQSVAQATLSSIAAAAVGHPNYAAEMRARISGGTKWTVKDGLVEMLAPMGPTLGGWSNNLFGLMKRHDAAPARFADWDWTVLPARMEAGEISEADVLAAREAIAAFLAPRTKRELADAALAHKILLAPVNDIGDLLASPHHQARGLFAEVEEDGVARTLPWTFAQGPEGMFSPPRGAPAQGQHNAAVLGALTPPRRRKGATRRGAGDDLPAAAPFEGLKVLDLAWVVAGPAIGRVLADYGATVIRVESSVRIEVARVMGPFPGGTPDPQRSALYDTCNTGKLGLALDLNQPAGREIVRDLTQWADVLIESFMPGQMRRWGLDAETLRALNPSLVGLSTALMGQSGPYATLAGFGQIGAAMAGFQGLVGYEGQSPVGPYGPYTDFVGPRFSLVALVAALDHRRRTGEGCWLDVSQAEAGINFLAAEVVQGAASGRYACARGNRDPQVSPNGVFACAGEDQWIAITAKDDAAWARLAGLVGGEALDAAFATLAGRKAQEDRLEGAIEAWTRTRRAEDVERELQALGVAAHKAAASEDMVADPQLAARGHFQRLPHPLGGESVFESSRFALSGTPARYVRPAPHFGRDAHTVLADILGYDQTRIAELEGAGVLR